MAVQQPGDRPLHGFGALVDPAAQPDGQADAGTQHNGKNYGGHIFHQANGADAHSHGAQPQHDIQLNLQIFRQLMARQRAQNTAHGHRGGVDDHSDRHTIFSLTFRIFKTVPVPSGPDPRP